MVFAQAVDEFVEVHWERSVEVLDLRYVVEAIADEDVVEARQLRHHLVVTPGIQQAADELAAETEVDDLRGQQVSLRGEQDADHVLQLRLLRCKLARDAGSAAA